MSEQRRQPERGSVTILMVAVVAIGLVLSLGTGLSNLRERLQLAFGGDAQLRLESIEPHGVRASLEFPVRRSVA